MEKSIRPYIFISYSHEDSALVLTLIEDLKARGFNVWYDAGIEAGTEWPEYIGAKVFYCNCMLLFLTQKSADSPYCRREIDFAVSLGKSVLTIYLMDQSEIQLSPGLRMTLNNKQAIFMTKSPTKELFLDNLCKAEMLKECRMTDEWDTLYVAEDEGLPEMESSAVSPLKAPKVDKEVNLDKARNEAEREYMHGCKLENEGKLEVAYVCYLKAAELGHPQAMFELAECLRCGNGTEKQEKEAYIWYQRASERGVTEAMLQQAKLYELTNGTKKGIEKAALLLNIAAQLNNTEAMYTLGVLQLENEEDEEKINQGLTWLKVAAKREHPNAMYRLGVYYRDVKKDINEALKWLDNAAYWRQPEALFALGKYYEQNDNKKESEKWYLLAAKNGSHAAADVLCDMFISEDFSEEWYESCIVCAQSGHARSMMRIARAYKSGDGVEKNLEVAAQWYKKAAYAECDDGMYAWAECCYHGEGTELDFSEAFKFYKKCYEAGMYWVGTQLSVFYRRGICTVQDERKAFEYAKEATNYSVGCSEAHYVLSDYYARGIGIPQNPEMAFSECRYAAEYSLPEAYMTLANYYEKGFGTPANEEMAAKWYLSSAQENNVMAMLKIADRYAAGRGVEKDPEQAYAWYQRAGAKGLQDAKYKMALCALQGFGTVKNEGRGYDALEYMVKYSFDSTVATEAALRLGKFFEEKRDWAHARRFYIEATRGGNNEAREKLRESRYCLMLWVNPRFLRAIIRYRKNSDEYKPIAIPWEMGKDSKGIV